MPSISLVVTTYNWKEALALCLDSIATQRVRPLEVIVADDGSRVDTGELVRERARDFPVPLFHVWQEDLGFRASRVRNLGIAASSGEYVVFIDGDMVLHPHFVDDHGAMAKRGTFLQGGRLNASAREAARLLAGGRARFSPWMPFAPHVRGELKRKHAIRAPGLASRVRTSPRIPTVMSCNLGVWRHDLDTVNGFDDAYEGWGREDNDIAARLRHSGVVMQPLRHAALAVHLYHPTRWPDGVLPAEERELPNDRLLRRTLETRAVRCERGLDAHVHAARGIAGVRSLRPDGRGLATAYPQAAAFEAGLRRPA